MQGLATLPYGFSETVTLNTPSGGIADISRGAAQFMLTQLGKDYGRGGDTILAHLTEGEMVVPLNLLEENPAITTILKKAFEEHDVDMSRYIVGNELNMKNPVTGQPEFFGFVKKAFKKIRKSLKKVFKKVGSFLKKAAPFVLPFIAPFALPMLGSAVAAGIGSLAGNLIAGADFKDALKGAALTGLTAGVAKGIGSKMGGGTFGEGFKTSFTGAPNVSLADAQAARAARIQDLDISSTTEELAGGVLDPAQVDAISTAELTPTVDLTQSNIQNPLLDGTGGTEGFETIKFDGAGQPTELTRNISTTNVATGPDIRIRPDSVLSNVTPDSIVSDTRLDLFGDQTLSGMDKINQQIDALKFSKTVPPAPDTFLGSETLSKITPDFIENPLEASGRFVKDTYNKYISPSRFEQAPIDPMAQAEQISQITEKYPNLSTADATKLVQQSAQTAVKNPGLFRQYGPMAALATTGAYALGAFGEEEVPPPEDQLAEQFALPTGYDLYASAPPGTYGIDPRLYLSSTMFAPQFNPAMNNQRAMIGQRRNFLPERSLPTYRQGGGEIQGPGTGTSDDIPAMLSDGEFVMTAQAVRGAGNGNRRAGAQRMYDLMHQYESMAN